MHHFEIDLPARQAALFDRVVDRFVTSELICRPDIDIKITRYPAAADVQRRRVALSSPQHLQELWRCWEQAQATRSR